MSETEIVIIGAGASGLAVAATLQRRGRKPVVLERDEQVGERWSRRYDRLCLHTIRRFSGLPYYSIPSSYPKYVPKEKYASYLDSYVQRMDLDVRLGQTVEEIRRVPSGWSVLSSEEQWLARAVVVATGQYNQQRLPTWPGLEHFRGRVLHSVDYRTGREFAGLRALVVGIGNTGCEIAVDLIEQGAAFVAISVRTSPPISSREIAGIPVQLLGMLLIRFPARAVDRAGAALRRISHGDLSAFGIGPEEWGPFVARRPPVIDVGFLAQLKAGQVVVRPDIVRFSSEGVEFANGQTETFDVVVGATGFTTGLDRLITEPGVLDERGYPRTRGGSAPGLLFAGYAETPRGQLFESNRSARGMAAAIDRYLGAEE